MKTYAIAIWKMDTDERESWNIYYYDTESEARVVMEEHLEQLRMEMQNGLILDWYIEFEEV